MAGGKHGNEKQRPREGAVCRCLKLEFERSVQITVSQLLATPEARPYRISDSPSLAYRRIHSESPSHRVSLRIMTSFDLCDHLKFLSLLLQMLENMATTFGNVGNSARRRWLDPCRVEQLPSWSRSSLLREDDVDQSRRFAVTLSLCRLAVPARFPSDCSHSHCDEPHSDGEI